MFKASEVPKEIIKEINSIKDYKLRIKTKEIYERDHILFKTCMNDPDLFRGPGKMAVGIADRYEAKFNGMIGEIEWLKKQLKNEGYQLHNLMKHLLMHQERYMSWEKVVRQKKS
ncbi:MAG: hypothetical protein ACPLXC_01660 [Candidatus Pacearchaeota archaeon]